MHPVIPFGSTINNTYISTVKYGFSNFRINIQRKHGPLIKITDESVNIIQFKSVKAMIWLKYQKSRECIYVLVKS